MIKFFATIEFLSGQQAAILTLTNEAGEWAGSGRVEGRDHSNIYERAYTLASLNAQSKGGRLERLSIAEPAPGEVRVRDVSRRETCGASVTPAFQHRPGNALNVEPIQPWARCLDKKPAHWPEGSSALRWMASGGEAWVFGPCSANCPRQGR
jgi:hypothetical protein